MRMELNIRAGEPVNGNGRIYMEEALTKAFKEFIDGPFPSYVVIGTPDDVHFDMRLVLGVAESIYQELGTYYAEVRLVTQKRVVPELLAVCKLKTCGHGKITDDGVVSDFTIKCLYID